MIWLESLFIAVVNQGFGAEWENTGIFPTTDWFEVNFYKYIIITKAS